MKLNKLILLSILMYCNQFTFSQSFSVGLKAILRMGTHEVSYGIGLHSSFQYQKAACNFGNDIFFSKKSLANRQMFWTNRVYLSPMFVFGPKSVTPEFEWGTLQNHSDRSMAFGFSSIYYWDQVGSSQRSGAFSGEWNGNSIFFENDFFAGQGRDRFRSAFLQYKHRTSYCALKMGIQIWTGETSGLRVQNKQIKNKLLYFKDLSINSYGKTSHGILYGGISYNLGFGQSLDFRLGIDSEGVRDVFQNKIGHASWLHHQKEKAVVYPKLKQNGFPTFNKTEVKKIQPYLQLCLGVE